MDNKGILFYSHNSIFFILIAFSFFNLIYCLIENFHFHRATKLNNGNFLLFSCNGMYELFPDLNTSKKYSSETNNNYEENIVHFLDKDGGYILYISYYKHYIFSREGNILKDYAYSLNSRSYYQYSVIPYTFLNGYLIYYLIYYQNSTTIIFQRFEYNYNTNIISHNSSKDFFYNLSIKNNNDKGFIACEIMKHENNNVIACFLGTSLNNNNNSINCIVFDYNFKIINISQTKTIGITNFYNIKSSLMTIDERKKALIVSKISHIDNENNKYFFFMLGMI